MTFDQAAILAVLVGAFVLFLRGTWRYDVVALLALVVATLLGLVPKDRVFMGFGQPAVATVGAVLVIGRALQNCGVVDLLSKHLANVGGGPVRQVATLAGVAALVSGFMNNVGAVALLMPVALRVARERGTSPSVLLMPLAFASLLGGLTTLIGTPPNLIVAAFRASRRAEPFGMFDFTPVGGIVALLGVAFLALLGWRLIPRRGGAAAPAGPVESYMTELRVPEGAAFAGKDVEALGELDVVVAGIVRAGGKPAVASRRDTIREGDLLVAEVDPDRLEEVLRSTGFEIAADKCVVGAEEIDLAEAVIKPDSPMIGETAGTLRLRQRHGVNLLAIARGGTALHRLRDQRFRAGDVLLLQAPAEKLGGALAALSCLPLAERGLRLGSGRRLVLGVGVFVAAIAATALGLLPTHVALAAAALAMVIARLATVRETYDAIDFPVLILLGAVFPIGEALETTGAAGLLADGVLAASRSLPPWASLAIVLVATMCLSDVVNNAAAAVLMAPVAIGVAKGLDASPDAFLMAVAIGGSCAFLTPIGHQSNLLVMGPGGYRFGDYWRVGLPLEILIAIVSVPMLLLVWPL